MTRLLYITIYFIKKNAKKIIICIKKRFEIILELYDIDLDSIPPSTIFRHPFSIIIRVGNYEEVFSI